MKKETNKNKQFKQIRRIWKQNWYVNWGSGRDSGSKIADIQEIYKKGYQEEKI